MSGSPVATLRRIQAAVTVVAGVDIPSLPLTVALLKQMDSGSLRLDRSSLEAHRARLRNWQIADQILSAPGFDPETLREAYATYAERAKADGLTPMAFPTFRLRHYALPAPVPPARARF